MQRCSDDLTFVVSSNDDAGGFGKIHRRRSTKTVGEVDHDQGANHYQHGRNNHKSPEKFLNSVHNAETGAADVMRHRLSSGQWRHQRVASGIQKFAQRHDGIIACLQVLNDARERFQRLRAIASRVMQQNDIAVMALLLNPLQNDVRARSGPILRVDVLQNDKVILILRDLQRR